MNTIIGYRLDWIDTVFIEEVRNDVYGKIVDLYELPRPPRIISIICKSHLCDYSFFLTLTGKLFKTKLQFVVQNVKFKDSRIILHNINIHFKNVEFVNSTISDYPVSMDVIPQEIVANFTHVRFYGISMSNSIDFKHHSNILIIIQNSCLENCGVVIETRNLLLQMKDSVNILQMGTISVHVNSLCFIYFQNVTLNEQTEQVVPVRISSKNLYLEIVDSLIENAFGGIVLEKTYAGLVPSCLQVRIVGSKFLNNTKKGLGGSISIIYVVPTDHYTNIIVVVSTIFVGNRVFRSGYKSSYGGALSVQTKQEALGNNALLLINIINSTFINNQAENGGGAIYTSKQYNYLTVYNTNFILNDTNYVSPESIFILAHSDISIDRSIFNYSKNKNTESLFHFNMLSDKSTVVYLDLNIICQVWHKLAMTTDFMVSPVTGKVILQKLYLKCIPCQPSYYILTDGFYKIQYTENRTDVEIIYRNITLKELNCLNCPHGAYCPGQDVRSKPNYWGFRFNHDIVFQQCPVGVCCTGSKSSPCTSYNSCSGNRAGTLCGGCGEGYSSSLLSKECLVNSDCSMAWFWPVSLLAVVSYVLWYTFKEDIAALSVATFKTIIKNKGFIKHHEVESTHKSYFGILIYYVQAGSMLRLSIELNEIDAFTSSVQVLEKYTGLFLSIDISYFSYNFCPINGLTTTDKLILRLIFLMGIYISWLVVFELVSIISYVLRKSGKQRFLMNVSAFKLRLIKGLIEIVKYTYGGVTGIVFMSLTCVAIGTEEVWFYDGTVNCYSKFQVSMIALCVTYILPFPFLLILGMNLLKKEIISSTSFLCGCFLPLPFLIIWFVTGVCKKQGNRVNTIDKQSNEVQVDVLSHKASGNVEVKIIKQNSEESETVQNMNEEILNCFQGAYNNKAKYWESVMILRRLLLGATVLIPNSIYQMASCTVLCLMFLVHHIYEKPFLYQLSNKIEFLSLFFLCLVSTINIFKSVYIDLGMIPQGASVNFFKVLRLLESLFVLVLILFIVILEIIKQYKRRKDKRHES